MDVPVMERDHFVREVHVDRLKALNAIPSSKRMTNARFARQDQHAAGSDGGDLVRDAVAGLVHEPQVREGRPASKSVLIAAGSTNREDTFFITKRKPVRLRSTQQTPAPFLSNSMSSIRCETLLENFSSARSP